jgi:hypothetical protein
LSAVTRKAKAKAIPIIIAFKEVMGFAGLNLSTCTTTGSGDLPVGHFCVESPLQEYFASPVGQIISTNSRRPTPLEGRIAIVTDAGRDAVDAAAFCARRDLRAGFGL